MESIEQNSSSHLKRKIGNNNDDNNHEHFYAFDIEHEQTKKTFCSHSPININSNNLLKNYQQTTKIIQEFNIQQSTTSDITVSSTINIKSTPKQQQQQIKTSNNNDFLSEDDFQRVVQDITPADRDLFDEFLNGIKQKTDDYLFLSSFDDLPSTINQEQDSNLRRYSSLSLPTQTSTTLSSTDRRRNSIPRGSSTIHYSPHTMPITNRPTNVAAQTLKQMAVQHQQRAIYNQQYPNIPYNNSTRQYYQQIENDSNSYYPSVNYSSIQQTNMSSYNQQQQQQQHSNIYGIQNYSYQTSSSFYPQQQMPSSSYYSSSNILPTTTNTHPTNNFYSQEDHLPILDL